MTHPIPEFLQQFALPAEALQDFQERGIFQKSGGKNLVSFEFNGHDRGVSYRFLKHPVKHAMKSEEFDMEINDDVVLIEWTKDRRNKITERVHMIGDALLKFRKAKNKITNQMETIFPLECVGGLYAEAYKKWENGMGSEGLELSRWNKLTVGQVKTLQSEGIFTVEQFASMPTDRVEGRFPKDLVQAFRDAMDFCKAQKPLLDVKEHADEMMRLKQETAKQAELIEQLTQKLNALDASMDSAGDAVKAMPKKGKRGRPPKGSTKPKGGYKNPPAEYFAVPEGEDNSVFKPGDDD